MNLDRITIVLSRPENSQNVGAVCRAMAACAIGDLRIVGRREDYDDGKVRTLALHASPIWDRAKFFGSIIEATRDCALSAGTTRRRGKKRKAFLMLPEEVAAIANDTTSGGRGARFAVVFGNERTGLTDSEMDECTMALTIPSSAQFASLNLSHAVQVVCYCLFREAGKLDTPAGDSGSGGRCGGEKDAGHTEDEAVECPEHTQCGGVYRNEMRISSGWTAIALSRLDEVTEAIAAALKEIGFFSVSGEAGMEETIKFWRGVLARSRLSEGEARYIEHIFNKARGMCSKQGTEGL